ncbi:MAG TPA: hypothetical protein VH165_18505, partial [Kofleriaceae bacterium]|nr:hypothetical protein [Kofleriaceae bacterium]
MIVEVEPGPLRAEVLRRIESWSRAGVIARLTSIQLDPDATLSVQLAAASGAIVTGLEPPAPLAAPTRDWISEL